MPPNTPFPVLPNFDRIVDALQHMTIAMNNMSQVVTALPTTVLPTYAVASLPSPAQGLRAFVSDSTVTLAAGLGNIVAGTGGNFVPVYADNAGNWRIG